MPHKMAQASDACSISGQRRSTAAAKLVGTLAAANDQPSPPVAFERQVIEERQASSALVRAAVA
ncbi:hypothetical protein [Planomonospora sphaerica]|uniref:hypothetical protein n=1 Tax=Planomonospora sphaerica TaxID=161355 RepID=UPI00083A3AD9|nr:hypothetical protein [Planomonospora sphaerica]